MEVTQGSKIAGSFPFATGTTGSDRQGTFKQYNCSLLLQSLSIKRELASWIWNRVCDTWGIGGTLVVVGTTKYQSLASMTRCQASRLTGGEWLGSDNSGDPAGDTDISKTVAYNTKLTVAI